MVGHVGHFVEQKNHAFLVDLFAEIVKQRKDAFLLMIGAGVTQDSIREKMESGAIHGKYLILENRSDVPEIMNTMDVFVFHRSLEDLVLLLLKRRKQD